MSFRIEGLDPGQFSHLAGLDDAALARCRARRCVVEAMPGFPDRIGLCDLAPAIDRLLADGAVAYLHAHYATRGCFAARIDRV